MPTLARRWLAKSALVSAAGLCGLLLLMPRGAAETGAEAAATAPIAPGPMPAEVSAAGDAELRAMLDAPGNIIIAGDRTHSDLLRRFYAAHDYTMVWDTRPAQAESLLTAVSHAADHGLDPGSFHMVLLTGRAAGLSPIERDLLLSDAFLGYADALARGAVPVEARIGSEALQPEPVDIVAALDAALAAADPARAIEALAPQTAEYAALQRAYARYRAKLASAAAPRAAGRRRGDPGAAARLRKIAVALERLRWLPRVLPPDRLWVNTADARLQLFRDGQPVFSTRVIVGEDGWQTPEFASAATSVLFNPPWFVPRSIFVKEILPRLASDPGYLARHHMSWRRGGTLRQEPGPHSALGRLKFEMPNRFDVFLHDTPMKGLFAGADRRRSHGCVRVENPNGLAAMLLQERPEAIGRAISVGYTHRQDLPEQVPVFVVYQTVVVEADGSLQFRPDPYGRDGRIWRQLTPSTATPLARGAGGNPRKG